DSMLLDVYNNVLCIVIQDILKKIQFLHITWFSSLIPNSFWFQVASYKISKNRNKMNQLRTTNIRERQINYFYIHIHIHVHITNDDQNVVTESKKQIERENNEWAYQMKRWVYAHGIIYFEIWSNVQCLWFMGSWSARHLRGDDEIVLSHTLHGYFFLIPL
ncbi:hypothetical protein ACJX0J_033196, partial [Zea mays]